MTGTGPLFTLRYEGRIEEKTVSADGINREPNAPDNDANTRVYDVGEGSRRRVSLTLGNNITLQGISAGVAHPVVLVQERTKFVMLDGSKITGHRNTNNGTIAAVRVETSTVASSGNWSRDAVITQISSDVVPFFNMKGGTITGNTSAILTSGNNNSFDSAGGLSAAHFTHIRLEGGSITGNFCEHVSDRDIVLANRQSGFYYTTARQRAGFFLSGDATIGNIAGRAAPSATGEKSIIGFGDTWTGTAGIIDLSTNTDGTATTITNWNTANWQVFRVAPYSSMTTAALGTAIGKFTAGNFIGRTSSSNFEPVIVPISNTHQFSTSGANIGALVGN
jgi:hypothetical protein